MPTRYFALLHGEDSTVDNPSGIFREVTEPGRYSLERLDPSGDWILDTALAAYRWQGEDGAEPIPEGQEKKIITDFLKRVSKKNVD